MERLPDKLDTKACYQALTDTGTYATVLHVIALTAYGEVIYKTDPVALFLALEEDFHAKIPEDNENKLNAITMAVSTPHFYTNPEAFRGVCETLSNGDPGVGPLESLTFPEIVWGCYEVGLNAEELDFSEAVTDAVSAAIGQEADERLEQGMESPELYVAEYFAERHTELCRQLASIGVSPSDLPSLPQ